MIGADVARVMGEQGSLHAAIHASTCNTKSPDARDEPRIEPEMRKRYPL